MYANDGLLLVKAIVTEKNIQPLLNLLIRFFFPPKLSYERFDEKWWTSICSKNNGLIKLSNGPYGVVTSVLVLA